MYHLQYSVLIQYGTCGIFDNSLSVYFHDTNSN